MTGSSILGGDWHDWLNTAVVYNNIINTWTDYIVWLLVKTKTERATTDQTIYHAVIAVEKDIFPTCSLSTNNVCYYLYIMHRRSIDLYIEN